MIFVILRRSFPSGTALVSRSHETNQLREVEASLKLAQIVRSLLNRAIKKVPAKDWENQGYLIDPDRIAERSFSSCYVYLFFRAQDRPIGFSPPAIIGLGNSGESGGHRSDQDILVYFFYSLSTFCLPVVICYVRWAAGKREEQEVRRNIKLPNQPHLFLSDLVLIDERHG